MIKKALSLTLILTAAFGLTAKASAQDCCQQDQTECAKTNDKECHNGKKCNGFNPFDGLNLSADQQTRLDMLAKDCPKSKTCGKKSCCQEKDSTKTCRPQADKKACCATDSCKAAVRANPAESRAEYLAKVKEILSSEQYVMFLENIVVNDHPSKRLFSDPTGPMMRDPKTGKLVPKGRPGMRLQRPRPVPTDNTTTSTNQ